MDTDTRRARALALLKDTGMWRSSYEPPYLRALWRLGFDVRPPHFLPFYQVAIIAMAWFTVVWGTTMWLLVWARIGLPGKSALAISCGAGLFFGLSLAAYYAHGRRKYKLPTWSTL